MVDLIKLKAAIKKKDGWWATKFSGPAANFLLRYIADLNWISPNHVTLFALFLGMLASLCFIIASPLSMLFGALLVQLSFIVDCMDGQLARYRQQFSKLGAWLDRIADRVKDFLYFFSLALGFYLKHSTEDTFKLVCWALNYSLEIEVWLIWPLAMLAMFTVLLIDYYVNQDMKLEAESYMEKASAADLINKSNSLNLFSSLLLKIMSFGKWVYKYFPVLRFNIGEQALLISLFTLFNSSFLLVLLFASLGTFYVLYWPVARLKGFTFDKNEIEK